MRARRAAADDEKHAELAQRSWELVWKAGASRRGSPGLFPVHCLASSLVVLCLFMCLWSTFCESLGPPHDRVGGTGRPEAKIIKIHWKYV